MGSVLSRIGAKKPKMSTLEKSKLDWDSFKSDEGITEELAIHNRGKEGWVNSSIIIELQVFAHNHFQVTFDVCLSSNADFSHQSCFSAFDWQMNNSLNYRFPLKILIFITYIRNRGYGGLSVSRFVLRHWGLGFDSDPACVEPMHSHHAGVVFTYKNWTIYSIKNENCEAVPNS